jgi:hypothetical protein
MKKRPALGVLFAECSLFGAPFCSSISAGFSTLPGSAGADAQEHGLEQRTLFGRQPHRLRRLVRQPAEFLAAAHAERETAALLLFATLLPAILSR